jgi:glyoxylase-like metal-dependent hydrolase (beta-lactamase superfamily II)
MNIRKFSNSIFNSNSYVISKKGSDDVFIIDPGDSNPLLAYIIENNKKLAGVFLTHSHFDLIYGVNEILASFPEARFLCHNIRKRG